MRVALTSQTFGQEFTRLIAETTDGNLDNYLIGKNKWGEVSLFHKQSSCLTFLFFKIFHGYQFDADTIFFAIKDRLRTQVEVSEIDALHAQDHIKMFLATKSLEHITSHVIAKRASKSERHIR